VAFCLIFRIYGLRITDDGCGGLPSRTGRQDRSSAIAGIGDRYGEVRDGEGDERIAVNERERAGSSGIGRDLGFKDSEFNSFFRGPRNAEPGTTTDRPERVVLYRRHRNEAFVFGRG
jgi:hypothetical protein